MPHTSMGTAVPPPLQLLQTMRPLPWHVLQPPPEPSLQRLHQHATVPLPPHVSHSRCGGPSSGCSCCGWGQGEWERGRRVKGARRAAWCGSVGAAPAAPPTAASVAMPAASAEPSQASRLRARTTLAYGRRRSGGRPQPPPVIAPAAPPPGPAAAAQPSRPHLGPQEEGGGVQGDAAPRRALHQARHGARAAGLKGRRGHGPLRGAAAAGHGRQAPRQGRPHGRGARRHCRALLAPQSAHRRRAEGRGGHRCAGGVGAVRESAGVGRLGPVNAKRRPWRVRGGAAGVWRGRGVAGAVPARR